jgi:hypothetical protein
MKGILIITIALLLFQYSATSQNIGMHTTTPLARLHVDLGSSLANGVLFTGAESSSGGTFPSLGAGNRFMYYPMKVVFRAGYVDGTQWDNANVGSYSFAFGYNPIARSPATCAIGDGVIAGGWISTAFGNSTITKGYSSFVLGMYNDPVIPGADEFVETPMTPLFMVGNGDGGATRNNALTVFKNGAVLLKNYSTVLVDPGVKVPPVTGPGTRMMWLPEKSALRIGTVHNDDWNADSIGTWSTGIGYSTKAKGQFSLALGLQTTASGRTSTALGFNTTASGENAISMGSVTIASGSNTTALGFMTNAKSYGSIALGRFNDRIATSDSILWIPADPLLIVGNGTSDATRHNTMVIYKNGNIISKNPTLVNVNPGVIPIPVNGPGTRMMWIPEKGALRAGTVDNANWDADSLGSWSTGLGFSTKAKGPVSFAAGFGSAATGVTSTAFGYSTVASGENATAMGSVSAASGPVATALGFSTTASGFSSTAMGSNTKAGGANTTSLGVNTNAKSYASVALGRYNDRIPASDSLLWNPSDPLLMVGNGISAGNLHNAMVVYKNGNMVLKNPTPVNTNPGILPVPISGVGTRMMWLPEKSAFRAGTVNNNDWNADSLGTWSTAFGYNTKAKGLFSTALGAHTSASGVTSTAMGYSTTASGENAIAMGSVSRATGSVSTAMGFDTRSTGFAATAMGFESRASSHISSASGLGSIAKGYASTVVGLYNDSILLTNQNAIDPLTPLFIVGNGDGYGVGQRDNAMVVRKDGHVGIGTNTPVTLLHVHTGSGLSDGFLVTGDYNPEDPIPVLAGEFSRMMFFPGKAAFRAGHLDGEAAYWDNANVGISSVATGFNTTASGTGSVAMGGYSHASGYRAIALGDGAAAGGEASVALGRYALASGFAALATGANTRANGIRATAMGHLTIASGTNSFSTGYSTKAKGYCTTVVGMYNDSLLTTDQTAITDTTPLFIVGNGSGYATPGNAMVVYKSGITELNGEADINGDINIDGFTKLGSSSPNIKMKKLTGISASSQNAWVNIAHGLTLSKILSVSIIMTIPSFVNLAPSYTYQPGYEYQYQIAAANIVVINSTANSSNILSKSFTILITYEE